MISDKCIDLCAATVAAHRAPESERLRDLCNGKSRFYSALTVWMGGNPCIPLF